MRGEMDDPGNQPVPGQRRGLQDSRPIDDLCFCSRCRHILVRNRADEAHGLHFGFGVFVRALDDGGGEQCNADSDPCPPTHTLLRSS